MRCTWRGWLAHGRDFDPRPGADVKDVNIIGGSSQANACMEGKGHIQVGVRLQPLYCPPAIFPSAAAYLMLLAQVTQKVFHLGSLLWTPLALLLPLQRAEREFCKAGISKKPGSSPAAACWP
jgi:hypothetical protein